MSERTVITVTQLNRYIKGLLEQDENVARVYISGEISNFTNHYKSGHLYMSLKDENALVRAVMFRGSARNLTFMPENGMKVIVKARVSLYEKDGSYQIYIDSMEPDGIGALQIAYEQLKQKLAAEGLFDDAGKRPIPKYPGRIGVITSDTGAAVRDILNILSRRYPLAEVVMVPVLVQGEGAPPQLVDALERLNRHHAADVIIIGRGGGSIEDLWAFNDERVARAVAASDIPVISAVGHETDFTICDFVADLRAPTPSAAAELAVPDRARLEHQLQNVNALLRQLLSGTVSRKSQALVELTAKRCLASPLYYVEERQMKLDYTTRAFASAAMACLRDGERRLAQSAGKLDALSPLKVLRRGYAIPYADGKVVRSVHDVGRGDEVIVKITDGDLRCTVESGEGI